MYFSNLIPRVFHPSAQHVRWRYEGGWNSSGSKILWELQESLCASFLRNIISRKYSK